MKKQQAEAILDYLEFHLLTFVEETEQDVSDPDIIGNMYFRAHDILSDFRETLQTQVLLEHKVPLTSNKKI